MPSTDYVSDLRRLIDNAPVNLLGAAGLVFDDEGRVLLEKLVGRDDVWSLPGGLCELAEPPELALRREIREETGLEVLDAELLTLLTTPLRTLPNGHQAAFYTALYRVEKWSGEARPDLKEVERLEWFAPNRLPPLRGQVGRWAADWLRAQQPSERTVRNRVEEWEGENGRH